MSKSRNVTRALDRLAIKSTLAVPKVSEIIKAERIAGIVVGRELDLNPEPFLYEGNAKKVYYRTNEEVFALEHSDMRKFGAYLHDGYGLSTATKWMKHVLAEFETMGMRQGRVIEGRRFVAFDQRTGALYMTRRNGTARCLDGQTMTTVQNGEPVFFLDDDRGIDVLDDDLDVGAHGELIPYITDVEFSEETLGNMSKEQQQRLLTVWTFAVAFPDLVVTKPLLILEGVPGSGKSTHCLLLQQLIHGKDYGLIISKDGAKDFPVQLLRSPIALFDNVDSYIDWIPDAICAYTTVGRWEMRKLYTDSDEVVIKPMSFPVIASKNPASFRREDVADRTVIIRLDRRKPNADGEGGFLPLNRLQAELRRRRGRLFGEYLYICNQIVDAIRSGVWAQCEKYVGNFRQADFAQMGFLVGSVLGWDEQDTADMFTALTEEQRAHSAENDDVVAELVDWGIRFRNQNGDRFLTVREIYAQLEQQTMARMGRLKFSEHMLSARLRAGLMDKRFTVMNMIDKGERRYQVTMNGTFDNVIAFPGNDAVAIDPKRW